MRLLFVTPDLPYPPRKGYMLMAYNHIKSLAVRHTVDLITFEKRTDSASVTGGLTDWCNHIEYVTLPTWQSILNVGLGFFNGRPLQVCYYQSTRMVEAIDRHLRNIAYDAVLFQLTRMAQFRPDWYRGATVLSLVDPYILNYERSLIWRPWYQRPAIQLEANRLREYEPKQAKRFDRLLLASKADITDYESCLSTTALDWVPHGVDVDFYSPPRIGSRKSGMIVITGNMHYAPNVDAVDYFCSQVFPLVREEEISAQLWIVGVRPAAAVRRWASHPGIKVTGAVADVRPYLAQAMVSVCPIRLNVGTQTKILEALAMGTPVVTTSDGNRGVGATSGEHLYVADSPSEFANRVVSLLRGTRWPDISQNGRQFVVEHFAWDKGVARLEWILHQLIEGRRSPAPARAGLPRKQP
jgi:sugar transferase (PEP-CTERM/EpsH1 system associated)